MCRAVEWRAAGRLGALFRGLLAITSCVYEQSADGLSAVDGIQAMVVIGNPVVQVRMSGVNQRKSKPLS